MILLSLWIFELTYDDVNMINNNKIFSVCVWNSCYEEEDEEEEVATDSICSIG